MENRTLFPNSKPSLIHLYIQSTHSLNICCVSGTVQGQRYRVMGQIGIVLAPKELEGKEVSIE